MFNLKYLIGLTTGSHSDRQAFRQLLLLRTTECLAKIAAVSLATLWKRHAVIAISRVPDRWS